LLSYLCENKVVDFHERQQDEGAMPFLTRIFDVHADISQIVMDQSLKEEERTVKLDAHKSELGIITSEMKKKLAKYGPMVDNENTLLLVMRCMHLRKHFRPTDVFRATMLTDASSHHIFVSVYVSLYGTLLTYDRQLLESVLSLAHFKLCFILFGDACLKNEFKDEHFALVKSLDAAFVDEFGTEDHKTMVLFDFSGAYEAAWKRYVARARTAFKKLVGSVEEWDAHPMKQRFRDTMRWHGAKEQDGWNSLEHNIPLFSASLVFTLHDQFTRVRSSLYEVSFSLVDSHYGCVCFVTGRPFFGAFRDPSAYVSSSSHDRTVPKS
jgi:hypothetical protein